jgi:hypothetical protein
MAGEEQGTEGPASGAKEVGAAMNGDHPLGGTNSVEPGHDNSEEVREATRLREAMERVRMDEPDPSTTRATMSVEEMRNIIQGGRSYEGSTPSEETTPTGVTTPIVAGARSNPPMRIECAG